MNCYGRMMPESALWWRVLRVLGIYRCMTYCGKRRVFYSLHAAHCADCQQIRRGH